MLPVRHRDRSRPVPAARLLPCFLLVAGLGNNAFALEQESVSALSVRLEKNVTEATRFDAQLTGRWNQTFDTYDRSIVLLGLTHNLRGNWQFTAAYAQYFDRSTPGQEHRLYQQLRYSFSLSNGELDSSVRLEERYLTEDGHTGARLRILNRRIYVLSERNTMSLGYEWVFNLNDMSETTRRGVSQHRLIGGVSHMLNDDDRLEFEYQLRYRHVPDSDNRLQHQFQLRLVHAF